MSHIRRHLTENGIGRYPAPPVLQVEDVPGVIEKTAVQVDHPHFHLGRYSRRAGQGRKKNGVFVIPGIGRLVKAERKARIGRNPQTGAQIKIKAKTVVKFRVAKAAKDVIAPTKK